ncbi:MAG: DUF805 domain-containing protein [Chlorobi bacterium]|nr:DUF805 domain-containing protein [Chlorobiota bacterium]
MESFNKFYLDVFKNHYFDFTGRARRQEFWMFILFSVIVSIVLSIIDNILGIQILSTIYSFAVLLPSLSIGARRLHDVGKSGWWQLIALIPFIGIIVLIVFWVMDGTPGENKWGPNPKEV